MSAARRLARAQLGLNIAALESLNARRLALQVAVVDAQAALEQAQPDTAALRAAKADLDVLHPELAAIDRTRNVVLQEIHRQRLQWARTLLEAFLPELLSAIFLEVIAGPDKEWSQSINSDGTYNSARNRAPFVLSAVCSRWRSIAMDTAGLWAYIGVPSFIGRKAAECDRYYDRVEALLLRSKKHPLDVMLDWRQRDDCIAYWLHCKHYQQIFNAAARHIDRWRRVQLTLPHDLAPEHVTQLQHPAPLLEDFSIVPSDPDDEMLPWPLDPPILPVCPRIRNLCAIKVFIAPQHPLPSLRELYIRINDIPLDIVWDLLRQSPAIRSLTLHHYRDDFPEMPDIHVNFPMLVNLGLTGDLMNFAKMLHCMTMPVLNSLRIFTSEMDTTTCISETIRHRVLKLLLIGEVEDEVALDDEYAVRLSMLQNVDTFELSEYTGNSAEGLFAALSEDGRMWLKLRSVLLADCALEDACAEAFMRFALSRRNLRSNGGLSPFRVTLFDTKTPPWFDEDIRANFGDIAIQCSNF